MRKPLWTSLVSGKGGWRSHLVLLKRHTKSFDDEGGGKTGLLAQRVRGSWGFTVVADLQGYAPWLQNTHNVHKQTFFLGLRCMQEEMLKTFFLFFFWFLSLKNNIFRILLWVPSPFYKMNFTTLQNATISPCWLP